MRFVYYFRLLDFAGAVDMDGAINFLPNVLGGF